MSSLLQRATRRVGVQRLMGALDSDMRAALPYCWPVVARPKQLAPAGDWRWWLVQTGRGFGKTRLAAEWVRAKARRMPGSLGALVAQTPEQARAVLVEGETGVLAVSPPGERPEWRPALGLLRWPGGAQAQVYSAANPEQLRGPSHHWAWWDEVAKAPRASATYDNLTMGLRLEYPGGAPEDVQPRGVLTTTPRPVALMRRLVQQPNVHVTRGTTYENRANLARAFIDEMEAAYGGTRLGKQELEGLLLDDVPGALWLRSWFERPGFRCEVPLATFDAVVVAVDPAASNSEGSAETGVLVVGMWHEGKRRRYHVLADASLHGSPGQRARAAIAALVRYEADAVVVETNNGGDWIPAALQAEWQAMAGEEEWAVALPGACPVRVVTATRGKQVRAEPVATLYEQQGTVTHAPGLEVLEDQLTTWSPLLNEASPDRLDALVWAVTYLSTRKRVVVT